MGLWSRSGNVESVSKVHTSCSGIGPFAQRSGKMVLDLLIKLIGSHTPVSYPREI